MVKKVRITENDIKNIIKNVLNEISYGKAERTAYDEGHKFERLKRDFDDFYTTLMYTYGNREDSEDGMSYQYKPDFEYNNKYLVEIMKHAQIINDILDKKIKQAENINDKLQDFDHYKYWDSEEGEREDFEDKDWQYLNNKYPK